MVADYRKTWLERGYQDGMGSSTFLPAPPKTHIRVYYFISSKYGLKIIEEKRLKVARFADTNDPFELMGLMLREQTVRRAVKEFKKKRNDDTGIVCFSENWSNPLLWSHYAEKHGGVCLGFNVKRKLLYPVSYEEKRLMALLDRSGTFVIDNNLGQRLLLTKSHHWSYETERRLFVSLRKAIKEGDLFYRPFDNEVTLAEVILGPRCSLKGPDVWMLTQKTEPCAIVFRSRLEFGGFRVIRDGRDLQMIAAALRRRPRSCS